MTVEIIGSVQFPGILNRRTLSLDLKGITLDDAVAHAKDYFLNELSQHIDVEIVEVQEVGE